MITRLASYECCTDGWTWIYELFPAELAATGTKGEERGASAAAVPTSTGQAEKERA